MLQGRGVVGAGTPRLSGSRSDVHLAPPGGVRILASVRMLLKSLRPRGRGEAGMEGMEMRQLGSVDPGGQRWGLCTERMEMIQE